jgi:excisionase family DNA binding protein
MFKNNQHNNKREERGRSGLKDVICYIEQKDIFTVPETARYLTVCTNTVYKLIHEGKLGYFKIGCRYEIQAASIRKFVASKIDEVSNDT